MSGLLPRHVLGRFFASFARQSNGCWLWTGRRHRGGRYGALYFRQERRQRVLTAHRLFWLLNCGPISNGQHVLHRCDTPLCVNPDHLFLGTHADNMADKVAKRRHRFGVRSGTESHNAKLTDEAVVEIRRLIAERVPRQRIADQYGVSKSAINWIAKGRTWVTGSKSEVRDARE